MSKREETNGELLERYAKDIDRMTSLVARMVAFCEDRSCPEFQRSDGIVEDFIIRYRAEIKRYEEAYMRLVDGGCPKPESLVCPHCGYDGEFNVEKPEHDGFRLLTPILEPRQVMSYKDGVFKIYHETEESHDCFTDIANPEWVESIDSDGDEFEKALRERVKGQHLLLCGKCFKNFPGGEFVTQCIVKHDFHPSGHKWSDR